MDEVTPLSRIAGRFDLLGADLGECEVVDGFLLWPVAAGEPGPGCACLARQCRQVNAAPNHILGTAGAGRGAGWAHQNPRATPANAGAAGSHRIRGPPGPPGHRRDAARRPPGEPLCAADGVADGRGGSGSRRDRRTTSREADRLGAGRWNLHRHPPDDRWAFALARRGAARAAPKGACHRNALAEFDFSSGTLLFTEAGTKKRASLRLVKGEDGLAACDPGGLEVFATDLAGFASRLRESRHTLKRTLTDQRIFAGIGNAYSDEILLHAGFSPFKRARDMQGR